MSAEPAAKTGTPTKLVIRNIGLLLSGDLEKPIIEADTVLVKDGRISAIGKEKELDCESATGIIDANGTALVPGLIDSHVHPVAGDWTPRQNQLGWIDSCLHGGVTTMISAGEVHMPGRPKDVVGLKALAITAQRTFAALRPSGVKVLAGAPVIEQGMVEEDFRSMAEAGVKLLGEVGLGSVKDAPTARQMVGWARKHGMQSTIHTGGPSIPGSNLIDKDVVLAADADVIGHINGGHTALPDAQIRTLCEESRRALENCTQRERASGVVHPANSKGVEAIAAHNFGDGFAGRFGCAAARNPSRDRSAFFVGEIPAEIVFCFATGNTARMRALDCGLMEVGRAADFVIMDAPQHSAGKSLLECVRLGDLPGIGMTIIDGVVRSERSRNTPPAGRVPVVAK